MPQVQPKALAFAKVDLGGEQSPIYTAMPPCIEIDLKQESNLKTIAHLIVCESLRPRCGGQFALDRLCDLMVVNILRTRIAQQIQEPGMFAGLAHAKLRRVMVAMHDHPERNWRVEDFAELATMSRSQFMAEFRAVVGKTPKMYLKEWRMTLARIAIARGDRIKEIAKRFGYSSGDAFCRAFTDTYGVAPSKLVMDKS
ncbi:AraC family transcriptional regulator [Agarilytica rhodophyticola]|uniref:AraC family transcriptional regulator n=1 Tax=Agarilytica rhodophyticola TaxID=1737490 RepID=UPI00131566A0|nr:AraC family transcriptional regulator [Agarilytica rhodophyticola]